MEMSHMHLVKVFFKNSTLDDFYYSLDDSPILNMNPYSL